MELSKLVRYQTILNSALPESMEEDLSSKISPILYIVKNGEIKKPNLLKRLERDQNRIMSSIKDFNETIEDINSDIDLIIESIEPTYLSNSYYLYQSMMKTDKIDYILNRKLSLNQSVLDYLATRIQGYSNWKNAGGLLRPGSENWIEHMVACDPLYLIDTDHDLFDPAKNKFNELYQNRLRYYTVQESDTNKMLNQLPNAQFGFFLAYNFFHYKPFEIIKTYLIEIYSKLIPGGHLAFTFNDCSRPGGIELAERQYMCYTPGRMILGLCENLGYNVLVYQELDSATTWVEVRKPGSSNSIKSGQTLAEIIAKSK